MDPERDDTLRPLLPRPAAVTGRRPRDLRPKSFRAFLEQWNLVQGLATPTLHRQIAMWLDDCRRTRRRRLLLMVFRNAGKSTLVGLYCAFLLTRRPDLRILVVSAEQELAERMTRNVRRIIETHPAAEAIRPKRPVEWAADRFTVERTASWRDPSLLARGLGANITGARADFIVCDDVEVPNTCESETARRELRARLRELSFVLCPGGTLLYVGTPHHYHSIYAAEARREYGEERPFLDGYERLVLPILDETGESRWPERFPREEVDRIAAEVGPLAFRSQMMLEPLPPTATRLDPSLLLPYEAEIELREANGRSQLLLGGRPMVAASCYWDPAFGRPEQGDSSVVACVFADGDGHLWLHDVRYLDSRTRTPEEDEATVMCREVAAFAAAHFLPSITVETNGIGRFLPALLRRELAARGLGVAVVEQANTRPKDRRILEAFDPLLAARRLHVHRRVLSGPFLVEMRDWRPGGGCRDDGLDAVAGCIALQPVRLGTVPRSRYRPDWPATSTSFRARSDFRP
ncbi:hypothetical protein HRbin40_00131 [bacterium HR40]|nr:hypothetical protein HRbin40_00131 [bacterium HR40]